MTTSGSAARTATQRAVTYAKSKGKLITDDPNLRKPLWSSLETAKEQLIWGLTQADVVTFACTAAGLSTTRSGGISSVPAYEEVEKELVK